jgi:hypothetical protein
MTADNVALVPLHYRNKAPCGRSDNAVAHVDVIGPQGGLRGGR